ncbi:hypothetical protein [Candidatus Chloroploca sp. Khr17]|uniref:hypothetical protein n=1 Tax=Candidatus Chloroploca sp. Khr17 TaxID=2496869 RepID=UPI00101B82E0|nr:hypothetical protein [Candidatus Chloroploca sp. Khr17]
MNRTVTFRTLLLANGLSILLLAAAMIATSTLAGPTWQAAPAGNATTTTISYQGHLTNPGGTPVSATLPMTFNLYTASTGGTAVWTEQRSGSNAVPVSNGLFNVALGSVTPIPVNLFGAPLWLGISVNGDAEMSPRERLNGGYATVAGTVPDGSISSSKQTIVALHATDNQYVRIQGANENTLVSEVVFNNLPAGDVFVMATLTGRLEPSAGSAGTLWLETDGVVLTRIPTHTLFKMDGQYVEFALHSVVSNFRGGDLRLQIRARTEEVNADLQFGFRGGTDDRGGRKVSIIAGL